MTVNLCKNQECLFVFFGVFGLADNSAIVNEAITSRRSVRAFLDRAVPREIIESILRVSSRAPSGTNMQPWRVYVCVGSSLKSLTSQVLSSHNDASFVVDHPYKYYPDEFFEPYLSRRRAVGWGLYGLLGIERGDKEKMHRQHGRNFVFFDAPVGMIFTIDSRLEIGSWLDYGMFLENVMTSARGYGLDTCPQAAFAGYHRVIRSVLDIPENEVVVCGMALGYADVDAVENRLVTERADISDYVTFCD